MTPPDPHRGLECSLRVLYVLDGLRAGGKERQAVELLTGLAKKNDIVVLLVVLGDESFFDSLFKDSAVKQVRMARTWRWDPGLFFKLHR